MIPNVYFVLGPAIIIIILIFLSSRNRRIKKLLSEKTLDRTTLNLKLSKNDFEKCVYNIAKDFKYKLEFYREEDNQCVISDPVGFYTSGFYYLLDHREDEIKISLVPRYFLEVDRFGLFSGRLERLSAIVQLMDYSQKT
ncbi:MAG: hypothetical protein KAH48_03000 [Chlorobi bacterium]|nr:hypothetical protein [Chlorobiota bacterium]